MPWFEILAFVFVGWFVASCLVGCAIARVIRLGARP
jgi:hypothetical protein